MVNRNLTYSLIDANISKKKKTNVTYENLLKKVDEETVTFFNNETDYSNMDGYIALELDYNENYTKKDLEKIAEYYNISKRKKRKADLVEEIVLFELDPVNFEITNRRKTMWFYMEEIMNDNYLSKFLIFN
tara:strand:- start:42 stop:434 length:393 start_codon:yes stop_codon:yes gene_type:complete